MWSSTLLDQSIEELKLKDERRIKEREEERAKGLGDTIANITHATGLDKLAELYTKITGKPCGCGSRQEYLNKLFPYGVVEK